MDSTSTISRIISAMASEVVVWQNRPHGRLVPDRMDGWYCIQSQDSSKVVNKTVYLDIGLKLRAKRKCWVCWLIGKFQLWDVGAQTLKASGGEEILITAMENLNGFT